MISRKLETVQTVKQTGRKICHLQEGRGVLVQTHKQVQCSELGSIQSHTEQVRTEERNCKDFIFTISCCTRKGYQSLSGFVLLEKKYLH